jgi:hypothetical protein
VTFEGVLVFGDRRARTHFARVIPVAQHAGGWRTAGGSGGSDDELPVSEPRVNLGGGGSPGFYAGGRVLTAGVDIARVTCANHLTLEDDTEGGVVLFITEEEARLPATADLYDRAGKQVASHAALPRDGHPGRGDPLRHRRRRRIGSEQGPGRRGCGGGGSASAAGYIEIKEGRTRFVPVVHPARMVMLVGALTLGGLAIMRPLLERRRPSRLPWA